MLQTAHILGKLAMSASNWFNSLPSFFLNMFAASSPHKFCSLIVASILQNGLCMGQSSFCAHAMGQMNSVDSRLEYCRHKLALGNNVAKKYIEKQSNCFIFLYIFFFCFPIKPACPAVYSLRKTTQTWLTLVQGSVDAIPRCEKTVDGVPTLLSTLFSSPMQFDIKLFQSFVL